MRTFLKLFIVLSLVTGVAGCTSTDRKKGGEAPAKRMPRNFERPKPPVLLTNTREQAEYIITHYWDNFDFTDTMYCHAPAITEQAFVDFLSIFQYASYEKVTDGVRKLMQAAEVDSVMFGYFCREAERYLYEPNSALRNDEYFIPFLEQMVVTKRLSDDNKIRPAYMLLLAHKNRPGALANDLEYTLASGQKGRLYNIKSDYLLLMFYNPGCKECRQTMAEIDNTASITAAINAGKLKVLAVYPDENLDEWHGHLKDVPTSWINSYDKMTDVRNRQLYDLKAIPTLYLLDKDKKVILKDVSVGHINGYLESIK
ncbi:MAG: DUF5106 domain-containing protein [Tannerella sp.]|jgi:thioredoxin-related protein|nr:DUF5106 domain-containing protein [Tannerella sp.]